MIPVVYILTLASDTLNMIYPINIEIVNSYAKLPKSFFYDKMIVSMGLDPHKWVTNVVEGLNWSFL